MGDTPEDPKFAEVMKKIQWQIDYHALRVKKFEAAKQYLIEHPEALPTVEGFCI